MIRHNLMCPMCNALLNEETNSDSSTSRPTTENCETNVETTSANTRISIVLRASMLNACSTTYSVMKHVLPQTACAQTRTRLACSVPLRLAARSTIAFVPVVASASTRSLVRCWLRWVGVGIWRAVTIRWGRDTMLAGWTSQPGDSTLGT